jgi:hypothetical protein
MFVLWGSTTSSLCYCGAARRAPIGFDEAQRRW